MLPFNAINFENIQTNGRWQLRRFAEILKNRWAAEPLKPDIVSIDHRIRATMIFMTMGAAVQLIDSPLFSNAPQFIQNALLEAGVDIEQGVVTKAQRKTRTSGQPDQAKGKSETQPAAPDKAPADAASIVAEKPGSASSVTTPAQQADRALAIVSRAIKQAKETNELVEAANGIVIGTNNDTVEAMEDVVGFAINLGVPGYSIHTIPYAANNLGDMVKAFRKALEEAEQSDALVILEPSQGDRIAMTRNQDLIAAYRLGL